MNHTTLVTELTDSVALDRVLTKATYYTGGKVSFGVMTYGTCFFPDVGELLVQPDHLLDSLESSHLDFVVKEMDDRNFLVGFGEHVFGIVFQEEVASLTAKPPHIQRPEHEVLVGAPSSPNEHLLIGLLARTRLLKDIADRRVEHVISPTKPLE